MPLSTKPYKGARDFYPEDKRLQKYTFAVWRKVVESFGYEEYDAPILEPLDIYLAKSGEEIVSEQTYAFEDRGGRKIVIRPEMTPTVSRMVAAKRQELVYPLRWYSIPNLWRYERPQRGRLREHWQLNVDIFGVEQNSAELEIISLVDSVFKAFGAEDDMYQIKLNHRQLINFTLKVYLGLSEKSAQAIGKLIDRIQKMDRSDFIAKVDEVLSDQERQASVVEKLSAVLECKSLNDLPEELKQQASYKDLQTVFDQLTSLGINNAVFDPTLMRGFDYYTGIVFEVFDLDPDNNRSMMGGGRYDGLVGLFGVMPIPTVGFGWGDVTLMNFLETHHLLPILKPEADAFIALIGLDYSKKLQELLSTLRERGLKLSVDLSGRKLGDQIKNADKKGLNKVIIIGENELDSERYKLKDLSSGSESLLEIDALIKELQDNRV
jgi:histidyl-tRNA synthetase